MKVLPGLTFTASSNAIFAYSMYDVRLSASAKLQRASSSSGFSSNASRNNMAAWSKC